MPDIVQAEVTITKIWPPKGQYFAFNCAELANQDNKYGRVSAPLAFYKKLKENNVYRIAYHATDEGYLNLDTIITGTAVPHVSPAKKYAREPQPSNPILGASGMVNAILNGWSYGRPLTEMIELLEKNKGQVAKLFDLLHDEILRTKAHGSELQSAPDLDDKIPY